jgi:hypothetical protein
LKKILSFVFPIYYSLIFDFYLINDWKKNKNFQITKNNFFLNNFFKKNIFKDIIFILINLNDQAEKKLLKIQKN